MHVRTMVKIVFSTAFALLCGLTTLGADAYSRQVCAQAGIVKHPSTESGDWSNSYCWMVQGAGGVTRELDYPLQLDSASSTVYGSYTAYGSGWGLGGNSQVTGQLITMYQSGSYYTAVTSSPGSSTATTYYPTFSGATLPTNGSAFIALWAQYLGVLYNVSWSQ